MIYQLERVDKYIYVPPSFDNEISSNMVLCFDKIEKNLDSSYCYFIYHIIFRIFLHGRRPTHPAYCTPLYDFQIQKDFYTFLDDKIYFLISQYEKMSILKSQFTYSGSFSCRDTVKLLSRQSSAFNTTDLRNDIDKDEPYILVIDDMRWDGIGMHLADFINLLDGYFVKTEQKYKDSQSGELKGTIAITSNEPIGGDIETTTISVYDRKALDTQLQRIQLHKIREQFVFTPQFIEQIEKEAVGFSILTNTVYLSNNSTIKQQLKIPQSFFGSKKDDTESITMFEKARRIHMNIILKDL